MSLYTKARKHIDMNRVKELREEAVKEQKIAEVKEQQEEILAELKRIEIKEDPKYSNWRREINEDLIEINEDMTTASMGMINYPATGDADIVDNATALNGFDGQNASVSGGTVTLTDDGDNDIVDGTHTAFRQAYYTVDGTKSAQLKITISKGGGTSSWTDRGESWDDDVTFNVYDGDNPFGNPQYNSTNLTSGTHIINLPGNYKNTTIQIQQFAKLASDGSPGTTGALRITNVSLQRRTPLNVFVPLDDPEANAFIRGGLGGDEERRQRLKEQLEAGNELMIRMGLEPSKTSPGDIELAGPGYIDSDDAFDDPYYQGPPPDLDDDSDFDPDDFEYAGLRPDGTQGINHPGDEVYDPATKKKYKLVPKKGYGYNQWIPIEKAGGGGTTVAQGLTDL